MKKSVIIAALTLAVVFAGYAQTKKGPAYKNAKASEKYDGNTSVLIKENPNQFQGPEYKNFKRNNYEIEVIDAKGMKKPENDMIVSTEKKAYAAQEGKEKIIFRRVEIKDMKGKNSKGLKGPAYKNYRPGRD